MVMNTKHRKRVIAALSDEWQSTARIAKIISVNWYRVENSLQELLKNGIVELAAGKGTHLWRLVNNAEKNKDV